MTKLTELSIKSALDGMAKGEFTSEELTGAHIAAMKDAAELNCFITETPELALEQAKASDKRRRDGVAPGYLEGIPIAMKDLYCTKGVQTTAASDILRGFVPGYESTVSQNMLNNGMVMLGKASADQFAMGSSNTTSAYGNVISPWKAIGDGPDDKRVPGGSSGGSAAAVAARISMGATGTDTGGSIRQPASYSGITGIKPTYGRCSRYGIIAYASSLDQAGPMARSVEDCAIMLNAMAGYDEKDSTSVNIPVPDYTKACVGNVKGKKIGIPKEYRVDGMPAEIEKFWQQSIAWLKEQGAEIVDVSLPHTKYALPTYYVIAPAECSSNLARYDGMRYGLRTEGKDLTDIYESTRAAGFGVEVKRRIMIGTYVLSAGYYDAYYLKAQRVRALIAQDFKNVFEKVDALLTPPAPNTAFKIGDNEDDPVKMYLCDVFTIPASLAGLPGMVVPVGLDASGLPFGMQILGNRWNEAEVFNVATALERAANFTAKPKYKTVG